MTGSERTIKVASFATLGTISTPAFSYSTGSAIVVPSQPGAMTQSVGLRETVSPVVTSSSVVEDNNTTEDITDYAVVQTWLRNVAATTGKLYTFNLDKVVG